MFSFITKNDFLSIIVLLFLAFFFACKKEMPAIITPIDPCAKNYELYSKPYDNIFKEQYNKGCPVTFKEIYPDKYIYTVLGINPKNKYEICFLRQLSNTPSTSYDLLKYSFCTNQTSLIVSNVKDASDWSSQDYFIFVNDKDSKVYRIKSNGDSLTQLSNVKEFYKSPKWSPNGTKIILFDNTVIDANGNKIDKLSFVNSNYAWESDSTLFYCPQDNINTNFKLFRYNFNTKTNQSFYSDSKNGIGIIQHHSTQTSKLFGFAFDGAKFNYFSIDTKTLERTSLGSYENAFYQSIEGSFDNQLLATFDMRDTATSQKCVFNHRNHIALMNFDGTKERQVLIPE